MSSRTPRIFGLIGEHGKIIKPTDGLISLTNPESERYTLVIFPKAKETTIIISQEFADGKFFYKEYTLKDKFPKIKFIRFDTKHPKEDILE